MAAVINGILKFLQQDSDELFSYYTKQQVNILDKSLGIIHYFVQFLILLYVVGFVFMFDEGYLETEQSKGLFATQVSGECVSVSTGKMRSRFFSTEEITYPNLETGNLFVATRVEVENQFRGTCEDKHTYCRTDDDCTLDVGGVCTENKMCKEPSWCRKLEEGESDQAETYKLGSKELRIWAKSSIQFQGIAPDTRYAHGMMEPILYPEPGYNTFTVKDLLLLCDPPVRFEEVSELGAAVEVQYRWNCKVDNPFGCVPEVKARRIDVLLSEDDIGFNFKTKRTLGGPDERLVETRHGIRFYFKTTGIGKAMSLSAIIFKCATGMALLGFSPIVADFMMLNCFKLSKKYEARKYVYSKDFSDYFDKIEQQGKSAATEEDVEDDDDDKDDDADEEWRRKMDEEE